MWSSSELLSDVIPNCIQCGAMYDIRLCAPQILPCAHSFCLMCLNKEEQKKKRKCPICKKKYSSFIFNSVFADTIDRIARKRSWLDARSRACDECSARRPMSALRRCRACELQISSFSVGNIDCIICLECCVESHNGHQLTRIGGDGRKQTRGFEDAETSYQLSPLSPPPSIHSESSSTSAQSKLAALSLASAFSPPLRESQNNSSPDTTFNDNSHDESALSYIIDQTNSPPSRLHSNRDETKSPIYVNMHQRQKNCSNLQNSSPLNSSSSLMRAPARRPSMGVGARRMMRRATVGPGDARKKNVNISEENPYQNQIAIDSASLCSPLITRNVNELIQMTQRIDSHRYEKSRKLFNNKFDFPSKYEAQKKAVITKLNNTYEYI